MKKDFLPEIERIRKELKAHIEKKGLEDGDYARSAQVKANTLSSFLTGTTKVPRLDFFLALIQNTDFRPGFIGGSKMAKANFTEGMPREIRDAVQKAVQMVEDFIAVVPPEKRIEDRAKKGLFVMLLADHIVAGRQEDIPGLMEDVLKAFSGQPAQP